MNTLVSITAVTPSTGVTGTTVTVSGSGFGAAQGNGQIWLGSQPGAVSSWSDTQIIATVAAGSTSGAAQVMQSGVLSNAVPFTINTPWISGITPGTGSAGTSVTISGSGFGAAQSSGVVWLGSMPGIVSSWIDTQVVAVVDSNAVSGIVRIQQNGIWSNTVVFKVPPSLSTAPSVNLNPSLLSIVVGDTRTLQALDDSGQPLTGLTWVSSDATIATLSSDNPPVITAVGTGHVTITAGNAWADLTVYPGPTLPIGTVKWEVPGDGSGVQYILPAVPNYTGAADVFAVQGSNNVQAITANGKVAWTSNLGATPWYYYMNLLPDFQGGLIIVDPQPVVSATITKLDGLTGRRYPSYTISQPYYGPPAYTGISPVLVHTDGTVFTIDNNSVVGIDPLKGTPKFNIPLEQSVQFSDGHCGEWTPFQTYSSPVVGSPIIAGDGYAYFPYAYTMSPLATNGLQCLQNSPVIERDRTHTETHLRLLRVGSDGSYSKIAVADWTLDGIWECIFDPTAPPSYGECAQTRIVTAYTGSAPDPNSLVGTLLTNADQGVLYSWTLSLPQPYPANPITTYKLTATAGTAVNSTVDVSVPGAIAPVLQASDGTYFGNVSNSGANLIASFDQAGHVNYSLPGDDYLFDHVDSAQHLVAWSYSRQALVSFDVSGNINVQNTQWQISSWTGNLYRYGSVEQVAGSPIDLAGSFWSIIGGNHSASNTAIQQVLTNQPQSDEKQLPNLNLAKCDPPFDFGAERAPFPTCGNINAIEILTSQSPDAIFQNFLQTFLPVIREPQDPKHPPHNDVMIFTAADGSPINVTAPGQVINIELEGIIGHLQRPFAVITERVDPVNHVISVVTAKGHPLAGWRYWRVYSIGINDIVVETGAYDQPGPGVKNYVGYYLAMGTVPQGWEHFLLFVANKMGATQGINLHSFGGHPESRSQNEILQGFYDFSGTYTTYILGNVCQSSSCN